MIVIDDYVVFRLTFQFTPSSKVYGFSEVDLTPNGGDKVFIETLYKNLIPVTSFKNECCL